MGFCYGDSYNGSSSTAAPEEYQNVLVECIMSFPTSVEMVKQASKDGKYI
jgi:hypothetical protein